MIVRPGAKPVTLPTLMFVSPPFAIADVVVVPPAPTASRLSPKPTVLPFVFWKRKV